jgi:hypothetical protein
MSMQKSFRPFLEALEERTNPASPHFIFANSAIANDGSLVVTFKEAGLGDNQLITEQLTGTGDATYQWFNHGGNKPQGNPFQAPTVQLDVSGQFPSGKNGQITASLTAQPPPPPDSFVDANHSSNWVAKLDVFYSNLVVTDLTNNVSTPVSPSSISGTGIIVNI